MGRLVRAMVKQLAVALFEQRVVRDRVDMRWCFGKLFIRFPTSGPYQFRGVPREVWNGLRQAGSIENYYQTWILGSYERVTNEPDAGGLPQAQSRLARWTDKITGG